MITKRGSIICDICGKFCSYFDEWTPFGCVDPAAPEPYDPSHICKKCFIGVKNEWIEEFKKGGREGDYQKSNAEMEAAEKCGLKWVGGGGIGMLGTKNFVDGHKYISRKEYDRLEKMPYYGYCKSCGAERKGGYCSNKKCDKSFNENI